jgi:hypothetical protein
LKSSFEFSVFSFQLKASCFLCKLKTENSKLFPLKIMTPPNGHRHEHAEHGVSNRVVACRQRLRRIRAAQKAVGALSSVKPLAEEELLAGAGEHAGVLESAGLLKDAKAVNAYVERRR